MHRTAVALVISGLLGCTGAPHQAEPEPPAPAAEPAPEPVPVPTVIPQLERYSASHILIAFKGAVQAPSPVSRSRDEARELARTLRQQVLAGDDFALLARKHSDGPSGVRGGSLGSYLTGTMVPAFESAVASVEPGSIGPLVETPFGVHIVRRDALWQIRVRHIQVGHSDADKSGSQRERSAAQALIERALARLEAGEPFDAVAGELSDDAGADLTGGDLGWVTAGQLVPPFERAVRHLTVGARTGVFETTYGFHLAERTE